MISILQIGSTGSEVKDLQFILRFRGGRHEFDPGSVDGVFGPKTKAAVIKFQQSVGLPADGVVGVKTWAAMNFSWPKTPGEFLREGDSGDAVRALQRGMQSKDGFSGDIDGIFGPKTKAAVISFQKYGEPDSNTDGVVGPITWGGIIAD